MKKPRSVKKVAFPYTFEKNGRTGRIKFWERSGVYATHFTFAGRAVRNTFRTAEAAFLYMEGEFSKLDSDRANSLALHPLNADVQTYRELEMLLREKGDGATLREAVAFYLAHHQERFEPRSFEECAEIFVRHQRANNISAIQIKTLEKHFRRFSKSFGKRKMHEITTLEIADWLADQRNEKTGDLWSSKTRTSVLGSLVSVSIFAQEVLHAIVSTGKTAFQRVRRPNKSGKGEVEIYTPAEIKALLLGALEHDLDLLPGIVVGCFEGLRPFEFHAEGVERRPLAWEAFNWNDKLLHVSGQKVRSKATRDIPIHPVTEAWLKPFKGQTGEIWKYTQAYTKKMMTLREEVNSRSIYDGFRHSYASYRIRHLKGDLAQLAEEMGNSPKEIVDSYKRNVTNTEADAWFAIRPPENYSELIKAALALGQGVGGDIIEQHEVV